MIPDDDEPTIEQLFDIREVSFPDIVLEDEHHAASGSLNNSQILATVATNEKRNDENVT